MFHGLLLNARRHATGVCGESTEGAEQISNPDPTPALRTFWSFACRLLKPQCSDFKRRGE
jgi:hypothetical protein